MDYWALFRRLLATNHLDKPKDKLEDMDISLEKVAARSGPILMAITLKWLTLL